MAGKLIELCVAEVSFWLAQICLARTRQEPRWQIAVQKLEQKLDMELEEVEYMHSGMHDRWKVRF